MSNIYILEPPTKGKVLLKTTLGDLDIELWSKEAPLAARNFVQLCIEGYYDGTIFHRVVKGFIAQGGDPTGTGEGGDSIYETPFKDEFHQRLRFNRRGLVGMANSGKNDNGSQFFFTLGATPELNNKHTIFGKITGDTIYNMLKFEEADIGPDDRPEYPHTILSTEILSNPFPDIVSRVKATETKTSLKKEKKREKGVKDFKLLSFGDEAEEDEEEVATVNKNFTAKNKAAPGLIEAESVIEPPSNIQEPPVKKPKMSDVSTFKTSLEKKNNESEKIEEKKPKSVQKSNELIDSYNEEQKRYKQLQKKLPTKGETRESQTLAMLMKFRNRIQTLKSGSEEGKKTEDNWLVHELKCENDVVLAKDANTKADDWFDITDPRNELNKRKRQEKK